MHAAAAEGAMQTVYAYSGRDLAESRRALSIMVRNEFTEGDVEIQPSWTPGARVET